MDKLGWGNDKKMAEGVAELLLSYRNCLEDLPESLGKSVELILSNATPASDPIVVHMLGIPGSGKSTAAQYLQSTPRERSPVIVAFDQLMGEVPEYQSEPDRKMAFCTWEDPARRAGYCLVTKLLMKHACFIFDHSGAAPCHVDLLHYAKKHLGYRTAVLRLIVDLEVAYKRLDGRYEQDQRFVPKKYIWERAGILDELAPRYREIADEYLEIRNDEDGPAGLNSLQSSCAALGARLAVTPRP